MAVNKVTIILISGAIVSGAAAAYFTDSYINRMVEDEQTRLSRQYKPLKVVVAKQNLRVGDVLSYENLAIREVPTGFVHASAVRSENSDSVVGKRIMQSLNAGESLLTSFLATRSGSGFSSLIEKGQRAITFPVDVVSSMSGLLRPNDKIDLMVTLKQKNSVTRPLLKNITILATGGIVDDEGRFNENGAYQTITISTTPMNAAKITHARNVGSVTVVLRSGKDQSKKVAVNDAVVPITIRNLFGDKPRHVRPQKAVEIIIGK